ncbi:MAG: ATP-binding protein [Crocinitomicaceae bacterium]|jgi:predicted AAA+ superfamily ATPase|nr:ATP-binding protein [Crocinitomicaceae bacterium]
MLAKALRRSLWKETSQTAKEFKVVCVTGPRQSGKTTLCQQVFRGMKYVNLEDPDVALYAKTEPKKFLMQFNQGAILDEVQRVPELFNYMQGIVDKRGKSKQYVLSGSNNFLMQQNISQSLAGRVGYIELLPFSVGELKYNKKQCDDLNKLIFRGSYPAVVAGKTDSVRWVENYIRTYVERDVRLLRNVGNLLLFNKFLKICAGRAAQIINLTSIANEVGVDVKTIDSWISVLESSYIVFRLAPYHTNFNKRVIKSPKLYFHDTGVLCHLLGIKSVTALSRRKDYGAIFENFIVSEIKKNRMNKEQYGDLYFFRDSSGNEVDLIIDKGDELIPVEIKSSKKIHKDDQRGIKWFNKFFRQEGGIVIYAGSENKSLDQQMEQLSWKETIHI